MEILQSREQDLLVGIGREYFYGIIENAQTLYHKEVKEWLERFITNNLNFYANFLISEVPSFSIIEILLVLYVGCAYHKSLI